jgi:hypothetical protein
MNAQPATQETIQTTPSKCSSGPVRSGPVRSGPDWPCECCVSLRAKPAEGRSQVEKQLAKDFLRSYSRKRH